MQVRIGSLVELNRGGRTEQAEVLTRRGGGSRQVCLIRYLADGAEDWLVLDADGTADDPVALARAIVSGQPVHLPVAEIERVLAEAVLALAETGDRA